MIPRSVSVIIPAFNEGANIGRVALSALDFLRANFSDFELIIVDDGSSDRTCEVLAGIASPGLRVISNGANRGKGYSVRHGVSAARKEFVLFCDADLSTPLRELLGFFRYFDDGYDVVIGSRARPDSRLAVRQNFLRRSMGKTFNFLLQRMLIKGIKDTQCGFKCFRREQAQRIFARQTIDRFCFDAEVLFIARKWGLRIKEAGVEWANRQDSRVAIVGDSLNMFADLFRIRLNGWRGIYDQLAGYPEGRPKVRRQADEKANV